MPRAPRVHVPSGHYHIVMRGNYRQRLFTTPSDREVLNEIVAKVIDNHGARVHAYCWMTNHIHVILQVDTTTTGDIIRPIASSYARYRHKLLRLTGHLFERRYHGPLIDSSEYFQQVLRYVHLNPVEAGIVHDAASYPWSSHRAYLGLETIPWLTTDFGLSTFGKTIDQARAQYLKFLKQPMDEGGRRIASAADSKDPRIVGTERFTSRCPVRIVRPPSMTLEEVVERVCQKHSVSLDAIRSPSRARHLTAARAEMATIVRKERLTTLTALAAYLHRDPSALSRLIARHPRTPDASSPDASILKI